MCASERSCPGSEDPSFSTIVTDCSLANNLPVTRTLAAHLDDKYLRTIVAHEHAPTSITTITITITIANCEIAGRRT